MAAIDGQGLFIAGQRGHELVHFALNVADVADGVGEALRVVEGAENRDCFLIVLEARFDLVQVALDLAQSSQRLGQEGKIVAFPALVCCLCECGSGVFEAMLTASLVALFQKRFCSFLHNSDSVSRLHCGGNSVFPLTFDKARIDSLVEIRGEDGDVE